MKINISDLSGNEETHETLSVVELAPKKQKTEGSEVQMRKYDIVFRCRSSHNNAYHLLIYNPYTRQDGKVFLLLPGTGWGARNNFLLIIHLNTLALRLRLRVQGNKNLQIYFLYEEQVELEK
jgi:hypothetical protein